MMRLLNLPAVRVTKFVAFIALIILLAGGPARVASAQGVTTGIIKGIVLDAQKRPVAGATVVAIHVPSGTTYDSNTLADGRFIIPGVRLGGPYSVVVAPGTGGAGTTFREQTQENILVSLGAASDLVFNVQPVVQEAITVLGASDAVFNTQRTGASTTITREQLGTLPTISGRLNDITRLTPQSGGTLSFGGMDSRLNNITVDGSYFNNSFGLRNSPGDTSGVAPISLAAIEQIQVNIAPYDVRQGNFVGANVNTVTRSGTNAWHASFYHQFRNNSLVGTEARGQVVNPGTFDFRNSGGWVSGAIKQNKAFFFGNFEDEKFVQPGTTFRANLGNEPATGSVTRVRASDLDQLSAFLKNNFGYETGPYQDYDTTTPARRYLVKTDFNMNDHNKLVVRYNHLDSQEDNLVSNSTSLGFGNRRTPISTGLAFQNAGYGELENIRSIVGEWNSIIGTNMANNLIAGWTSHDESRSYMSTWFPFVDILEQNQVYTSFGFEPFTPNNELRYKSFQVQNNFQEFAKNHALTFGVSAERYESENVFNSASQSIYTYNSLQDFYTDANAFLNQTGPTGVRVRRFDLRWNNIPGQEKPIQPLKVFYAGGYVQDDWQALNNLTLNIGLRWDAPFFSKTGYQNVNADALTFQDENNNPVQYKTGELPGANALWSPRVGFNWDINSNRTTQLRGGSGVFSGRPAYVWISNQVGNTGMLTGTERLDDSAAAPLTTRPFNPNPDAYKPQNITGAPASSYNLEVISPDFQFPQVWRTNFAVDHRLPWDLIATFEAIYNRDVNGLYYVNTNLPDAQSAFTGADTRPRWTGPSCNTPTVGPCSNRINNAALNQVSSAVELKNQNIGRSWNLAGTIEKLYRGGLWIKGAYSYGEARNTIDPGSIAMGSFFANQHSGDPNNPGISLSTQSPGHRFFAVGSYNRDFFKFGTTTLSLFWESRTNGNASYVFGADANGDGGTANDLIYVPRDQSEMYFTTIPASGTVPSFTPEQQAIAWDAYIAQDPYLSTRRGQYAERNAVFLPLLHRLDMSVSQDVKFNMGGARHSVQFRMDLENLTNLLNTDWGVGQRLVNNQPLTSTSVDSQGRLTYRMRVVNGALMSKTFERTTFIQDVYRIMFSIRYQF